MPGLIELTFPDTESPGEEDGDSGSPNGEPEGHPNRDGRRAVGYAGLVYKTDARLETEIQESSAHGWQL